MKEQVVEQDRIRGAGKAQHGGVLLGLEGLQRRVRGPGHQKAGGVLKVKADPARLQASQAVTADLVGFTVEDLFGPVT